MPLVKERNSVQATVQYLVQDFNEPATARLFFRALVLLTFVKILMLWSFSHSVMNHHNITLPRSWFGKIILAPSFLANDNVDIFFAISLGFLVVAFFLRPNYFTTVLFFWLTFNLIHCLPSVCQWRRSRFIHAGPVVHSYSQETSVQIGDRKHYSENLPQCGHHFMSTPGDFYLPRFRMGQIDQRAHGGLVTPLIMSSISEICTIPCLEECLRIQGYKWCCPG